MPYYTTRTVSSAGTHPSINIDPGRSAFQTSVVCTPSSNANYGLQYSLDPASVADADSTWAPSVGIASSTTGQAATTFVGPVAKVRLIVSSVGDTIKIQVRQGVT